MALFKTYPGKKDSRGEDDDPVVGRESALFRLLKAESLHFQSYAFRSAFFEHCMDTRVLEALMSEKLPTPSWQRRVTGAACAAYVDPPGVSFEALAALEAEAYAAGHGCRIPALIFEAHAQEEPESSLLPEELTLLERSNYPLAYTSQAVRAKLDDLLVSPSSGHTVPGPKKGGDAAVADAYPAAGEEDGLLLQNLWILPSCQDDPQAVAWRLPLACGLVPAVAPAPRPTVSSEAERLRYKRQVTAAVHAAAVSSCDALLIGCAAGLPGTCRGREAVTPEEAAVIWADVLRSGTKSGRTPPVDRCFRQIVFCLGRERTERLSRARRALVAAFA